MQRTIRPLLIALVTGFFLVAGCDGTSSEDAPSDGPITGIPGDPTLHTRLVEAHNQVRQTLGLPPLRWSQTLGDFAQEWANTLQGQACALQHRTNNQFGENLASSTGSFLTASQVVDLWAGESAFYDHASNTCQAGQVCGHYTQLVWRATEAVGCGRSRCGQTEVWVCNYDPPGNIIGQRPF